MHVLYFHQYFSTPAGSTGTRSYEMARRLIARGHRVTMVCVSSKSASSGLSGVPIRGIRRGAVDGINIIELNLTYSNYDSFIKRTWLFFLYALRGVRLALTLEYDIVFATSTPLTVGIPGIFARLLRRKPFVFEVRDLWPELPREMGVIKNPVVLYGMEILEWISYHASVGCIGLSPGIVRGIVRRGISQERVVMVPNGCDLDTFDPSTGDAWRPAGVADTDFMVVFSGAHGIANGLNAIVDTAAELKFRGRSDIKIVFVGDGKQKPFLQKRVIDEKLSNCRFLDPIPKTKLAELLRAADAGLMVLANVPAFNYGTSPNKFFDYIAAGLPVVNNYPGWIADLVTQHDCGVAIEPGNARVFADALEQLADDRNLTMNMGRNARLLAEQEFSRDLLAEKFIAFIEACAIQ